VRRNPASMFRCSWLCSVSVLTLPYGCNTIGGTVPVSPYGYGLPVYIAECGGQAFGGYPAYATSGDGAQRAELYTRPRL
jgi:hypothetical protein